jgi:ribosome-binding factor A
MSELRRKRVESLIRQEIGLLINLQVIKDPRVDPLAVVTRVVVSKDMHYGKIFISFYGGQAKLESCVQALNHAAGFVQKELAERLRLRFTPKLSFHEDPSIEQGFRVTQKIRELFS